MSEPHIPTGWQAMPLGELGQYINGMAFKPSDWTKDGLPIIRIQNLTDPRKPCNHFNGTAKDRYLIDDGALLVSWSASLGAFIWNRGPALLNQHIFRVIPNCEETTRDFLYFSILNALQRMKELTHGSTMRHITKKKFEALKVPVPPLDEQRRIVARIREAMERVDELRRLREETKREAQALFGAALHEAEVSAGGRSETVGALITESRNGRSIKASGQNGNGKVLTLASVRGTVLDTSKFKCVDMEDTVAIKFQVERDDVFISRANTMQLVGLSAIARVDLDRRVIYPDLMIRLRPDSAAIEARFLMYALRFPRSRSQIRERATGSSQSMVKISGKRLRTVKIPVPTLQLQRTIADSLDEAWRVTSSISSLYDVDPTGPLRAAILRKAFAGEL